MSWFMNHEITHKSRGVEICKSVACNLTLEHMVQLHGVKKAVIGTSFGIVWVKTYKFNQVSLELHTL